MKKWLIGCIGVGLIVSSFSTGSSVASAETSGFSDIKGHWAESIINEAVERGITSGVSANKFAPNQELTYEQFMTMLARMLTEKDFIEDKVSGCNMVLTNYNEEFKVTNGDVKKLKEYRDNYLNNNTDLKDELKNQSTGNISDFNKAGMCYVNSWTNYYFNDRAGLPYTMDENVLNKAVNWARPALTTVPYVAGFNSYYDFISNNGKNIKDYNYTAFKNGLTPYNYLEWTQTYQYKRINKVFDNLNEKYIEYKISNSLSRADMALILYSFLNYEEQKLITYKQDNFYYNTWSSSSNPWENQDLNYKSFKSSYSDLPKYFQLQTMDANGLPKSPPFYMYKPERVFAKNAIGTDGEKHTNYEDTHSNEGLLMTNRGIILAVSDAGLLSGSNGKFNPDKSLTRAEGVAVALKLEAFLKNRYNFVDANSNNNKNANESDNIKNTLTKYYEAIYAKDAGTYNGTWLNLSDKEQESNKDWLNQYTLKYAMDEFKVVELINDFATVEVNIITTKINTEHQDLPYIEMIRKQKFKIFMKNIGGSWKIEKMELVGTPEILSNPNPEQI
ncbi:S-layer homology domain-containing protein [Paenibacillus glucanolyticus]|uniref:S-layer homology domain-containing protein n=1 Tax=Paenibacillus glucanolyticus TaxID=59843 RepID=UPI0030D06D77